jgi:hypothetical protein
MSVRTLERARGLEDYRPSYLYNWYDLDPRTFDSHGVICRRAPDGEPMFNFKQKALLLYPMDWKRRYTRCVEALALNILLRMNYSERRLHQPLRGEAFFAAPVTALEAFARDHLLHMEREGGHIPRDQIEAWCQWHLPRLHKV